ncbi:MAG TPA: spherulation-specific family 4 protein [Nitrososphaera sp.]|nr:spherulation-specific family 4 protein [Nitrososphaera sp.]
MRIYRGNISPTVAKTTKTSTAATRATRLAGIALVAIAASSAIFSIGGALGRQDNAAYADDGNGLVIPVYGRAAHFDKIIDAKNDNPGTELIVVINPSNGPGSERDSYWSDVIDDLQDAGVEVVGYVSTAYAGRSQDIVEEEADRYYDWYGTDGVFFDEVSPSAESYYQELYDNSEGMVILNPGAPVPDSYEDAADIIMVYENYGLPATGIESNGISEEKLGAIGHGGEASEAAFETLSDEVGYLYASPDWMDVASTLEEQADWAD